MTGMHPRSRILISCTATLGLLLVWSTTARPSQQPVSKELQKDTKARESQSCDDGQPRPQAAQNKTRTDSSQPTPSHDGAAVASNASSNTQPSDAKPPQSPTPAAGLPGTPAGDSVSNAVISPIVPVRQSYTLGANPAWLPDGSAPSNMLATKGMAPQQSQAPGIGQPGDHPGNHLDLGLPQAIQLSLVNNLSTILAQERRMEAHGRALESYSGVLPNVSASTYQASITANIAALGFRPGLIPGLNSTFLGPFSNFDARLKLVQNIFNLSAIRQVQSGRVDVAIANLQENLAREQVTSQTALAYLEALRSARGVEAAKADLELANSLFKLASDQHDAGIATGVDVTRAQTRVAQQQYRLASAQRASEQARLQLLRISGLDLSTDLNLTDTLRFTQETPGQTGAAIITAEQTRVEVQVAEAQVKLSRYDSKAAQAEQYPSVEFDGDYGVSGIMPGQDDLPTRTVMIRLNVPIFNGGVTRGRVEETSSRVAQSESTLKDVRAQVEQDVRLALQTLSAAADEVRAADQSFTLAERQLQMARDRFAAGVADNIEVINAQTDLADARLSQVAALSEYTAARISLAYALGRVSSFTL
jgi:outer membrane protein